MSNRTVVTAGPTISTRAVLDRLPWAEVVPPIAHGDVYGYGLVAGDTLAVIDGLFLQVASVRHRELLELMDRGVRLAGAASMGALRAAELHPYGMLGVGVVFAAFVSGELDGDDEVAVVHGLAEDGYPIFADALVNLRSTLAALHVDGLISAPERDLLLATAKHRCFERRAVPELVRDLMVAGRVDPARAAALQGLLQRHRVDTKRADAVALLHVLAAASAGAPARPPTAQRSYFTHRWQIAHTAPPDGLGAARLLVTAAVVCDDFADWRHEQLLEVTAAMHAGAIGLCVTDDPVAALAARIGCSVADLLVLAADVAVSPAELEAYAADLSAADAAVRAVTGADEGSPPPCESGRRAALEAVAGAHAALVGLIRPGQPVPPALVDRLLGAAWDPSDVPTTTAALVTRTLARAPGVPLDDRLLTPLRLSGRLPALRAIVQDAATAVRRFHDELPGATLQTLRSDAVLQWLTARWGTSVTPELSRRGLAATDLRAAVGPLVLLDRISPVPRVQLTRRTSTTAPGA